MSMQNIPASFPENIDMNSVYILLADDSGPPPSTVINQNDTFAKVTFKPSVVQQARIAQNGVLGDFVIRYDVNREQSIGDIQVRVLFCHFVSVA